MGGADPKGELDTVVANTGAGDNATRPGAASEPPSGRLVGRYLLLHRLGAGGMGVVYAAYDPELDRKVALKLLRAADGGPGSTHGQLRLVREAQAMARLDDPSVVAVHDAGRVDGQVFIAMELVSGCTLRAWLTARPRPWPQVLDAFMRAGSGLVAAHDAGLVHRDFKPDNVMLDGNADRRDANVGRVRVMDFGLAAAHHELEGPQPDRAPKVRGSALGLRVTGTGTPLGTPAYMSPEQSDGQPTDARSDQFSFCVALWEGLFRQRPFAGTTLPQIVTAITEGRLEPAPRGTRVPSAVARVLRRGLSVRPDDRWPTMRALLRALDRARAQARYRRRALAAAILVVGALAAVGWHRFQERERIAECEAAGAAIDAVWNDETRAATRDALLRTGASRARVTARNVQPMLDAHAAAWAAARTDVCIRTKVRQARGADALARASWCLEERKMGLEALVEQLSRADRPGVVDHAIPAAAGLARVEPCQDADRLSRLPAPPEGGVDTVRAVRSELARAVALLQMAKYERGLSVAHGALAQAEAIGWPPLTAAARHRVGRLLESMGEYAEAEVTLQAAYFEAAKAGAIDVAADAADDLAFTVGVELARPDDGIVWSRLAEVMLETAGDADLRRADHLGRLANIHWAAGAYAQAEMEGERAVAIKERILGPDHPALASTLHGLADAAHALGAHAESRALHERALAILEHALGPDHPDVATSLNSLGAVCHAMGSHQEAVVRFERAKAIFEDVLGRDHPHVAATLGNLGEVHRAMGSHAEAGAAFERALSIFDAALGPDHPNVAISLDGLAGVRQDAGRLVEAEALRRRALAIRERALGPAHPDVATSLNNLAYVELALGSHAEAIALYERALSIMEQALGPDHPDLAPRLGRLGGAHRAAGSNDTAKVLYERALAIVEASSLGPDHPRVAAPLMGLAQVALVEARPAEAADLAARALGVLEGGAAPAQRIDEARALLERAESSVAPGERSPHGRH